MATTPVFLPGKSHRQRSLVVYSPWGRKSAGHNLRTKTTIIYHRASFVIVTLQMFEKNLTIGIKQGGRKEGRKVTLFHKMN